LLPESHGAARAEVVVTRSFYWSVKRELWEHKALYVTPLAVVGILILGFLLNASHVHADGMRMLAELEPEKRRALLIFFHYSIAILVTMAMAVAVWSYCLDAMRGERRDRSILFWKSLPVSDLTTVLAKLFVPSVVVPAIVFAVVCATYLLLLVLVSILVLAGGDSPAPFWTHSSLLPSSIALLYTLAVMSIWYAPIHAWLLLVSSWARHWVLLWALLPPLAVGVLEGITFGTDHTWTLLRDRLGHGLRQAFIAPPMTPGRFDMGIPREGFDVEWANRLPQNLGDLLNPMGFLSSPGVWGGLIAAAAFILAAVWMRRYREPL
jgi:ABC-2 type transport system permease protein